MNVRSFNERGCPPGSSDAPGNGISARVVASGAGAAHPFFNRLLSGGNTKRCPTQTLPSPGRLDTLC